MSATLLLHPAVLDACTAVDAAILRALVAGQEPRPFGITPTAYHTAVTRLILHGWVRPGTDDAGSDLTLTAVGHAVARRVAPDPLVDASTH